MPLIFENPHVELGDLVPHASKGFDTGSWHGSVLFSQRSEVGALAFTWFMIR